MRIILIPVILIAIIALVYLAINAYLFWKLQDATLMSKLDTELHSTITDYIMKEVVHRSCDGQVFCSYKVLGAEKIKTVNSSGEPIIRAYLYTRFDEFCKDRNYLRLGSGGATPIVLDIEQNKVVEGKQPPIAGHFNSSVKKLFPVAIQKQVLEPEDKLLKALNADINKQVRQKFGDIEIKKQTE